MHDAWSSRAGLIFLTAVIILILLAYSPRQTGSVWMPGCTGEWVKLDLLVRISCSLRSTLSLHDTHPACCTMGMVVVLTLTTIGSIRHRRTSRWSNYCKRCSLIPTMKTCLAEINPDESTSPWTGHPDTRQKRRSIVATSNKTTKTPPRVDPDSFESWMPLAYFVVP
ncbi:hypothetical protein BDV32DRAFT_43917 [Aspergillus pseudonomiae]|uniref:Uncharacterized protein n=1 Tax=Aspergillus pseudonomiae TaxID=1506151 RepID=A0A5N6I2W3_9EURO|nr:uncharacterized protein BDV37DRAFT_48370 [Aspergillus pseudonomiae]KAB8260946.1 hypothetical protein BDV32DRAFT_43917 [Aspergillus pseudonomiae]KAE8397830.1 hypothetical protein BDV37DRAFT_48370 [Aspergillus pseudonomiae]